MKNPPSSQVEDHLHTHHRAANVRPTASPPSHAPAALCSKVRLEVVGIYLEDKPRTFPKRTSLILSTLAAHCVLWSPTGSIRWRGRLFWGIFCSDRALIQHADDKMRAVYAHPPPRQRLLGGCCCCWWLLPCCLRVLRVEVSHHLLLWHWYSAQVPSKHGNIVSRRTKRICKSASYILNVKCSQARGKSFEHHMIISSKCSQRDSEPDCCVKWFFHFRVLFSSVIQTTSCSQAMFQLPKWILMKMCVKLSQF